MTLTMNIERLTFENVTLELAPQSEGEACDSFSTAVTLEMLMRMLAGAQRESAPADSGPEQDAPDTQEPAGNGTTEPADYDNLKRDILTFLESDARYTKRSRRAVFAAMANLGYHSDGAVHNALEEMCSRGVVIASDRRSDGTTLYEAA